MPRRAQTQGNARLPWPGTATSALVRRARGEPKTASMRLLPGADGQLAVRHSSRHVGAHSGNRHRRAITTWQARENAALVSFAAMSAGQILVSRTRPPGLRNVCAALIGSVPAVSKAMSNLSLRVAGSKSKSTTGVMPRCWRQESAAPGDRVAAEIWPAVRFHRAGWFHRPRRTVSFAGLRRSLRSRGGSSL